MRDAVGGAFMIKLLLVFLAVYTIFIAIAINYAKAFRVKNKVLNIIEQNEGIKDLSKNVNTSDASIVQIGTYMNDISYKIDKNTADKKCKEKYGNGDEVFVGDQGYCIVAVNDNDHDALYYRVTTFVTISIPVVRLEFTVPINGETRKIEKVE